jgi:7-cyano-7-deazaguanine synthase
MAEGEAVAVVSGGMDSATLAYLLDSQGYSLHLLSIDYGQRHVKEIEYARRCAGRLGASFDVADVSKIGRLLSGSALTDKNIAVPHGHYTASNMAVTVVPNRNAIMLAIAYGVAAAREASVVAAAMHSGGHPVYPDCRPEFVDSFEAMQHRAIEGLTHETISLYTPFIHENKSGIIMIGASLGVPYADTWSCYEGGELHCGRCGTCGRAQGSLP